MKSLVEQLDDTWPGTEWRLMFHGTCSALSAFVEEGIGRGGDDNSALGVHLAEWPGASSEYAHTGVAHNEGEPRVLVVALPARKSKEEPDYFRFFGFGEDGMPAADMGKAGFAQWRQELLAEGYDVVDFEDGEGPISVALNPNEVLVLGSMTLEQAERVQAAMDDMADAFDAHERLKVVLAQGVALTLPAATGAVPARRTLKR